MKIIANSRPMMPYTDSASRARATEPVRFSGGEGKIKIAPKKAGLACMITGLVALPLSLWMTVHNATNEIKPFARRQAQAALKLTGQLVQKDIQELKIDLNTLKPELEQIKADTSKATAQAKEEAKSAFQKLKERATAENKEGNVAKLTEMLKSAEPKDLEKLAEIAKDGKDMTAASVQKFKDELVAVLNKRIEDSNLNAEAYQPLVDGAVTDITSVLKARAGGALASTTASLGLMLLGLVVFCKGQKDELAALKQATT